MSDFDREAEREKLRKKYERDKEKREASERMSELLLQGATMTNRHCPECHSPVFRYEGRQFCPTCQKEVAEEGEIEADGERSGTDGEKAGAGETEETEGTTDDDTKADQPASGDQAGRVERTDSNGEDVDRTSETDDAPTPAEDRRPARVQPPARPERETAREDRRDSGHRSESGGGFRNTEASLEREIEALTRRAEETRDVGRKRDLLAAAREAAETLQAVRRL